MRPGCWATGTWPGKRPADIPEYYDQPPAFEDVRHRPGPKPAGRLRLCTEAMADARTEATLDLARACLSLRIIREECTVHIEAFIERERNVLWVRVQTDHYGGYVELSLEKTPDSQDPDMPAPILRCLDERRVCVSQTIPAGCDVEPFTWSLCGHSPRSTAARLAANRAYGTSPGPGPSRSAQRCCRKRRCRWSWAWRPVVKRRS